jgi:RND family efflux transporter MFP subunit
MQFKYILAFFVMGSLIFGMGCHNHPHNPDGSHPTGHGHAHNPDGSHPTGQGHAHNPDGSHPTGGGHAHNPDGSHPTGGGHAHNPDGSHVQSGPDPLSFTLWTAQTELFVEFPPMVVGQESRFAAHFSDMSTFKAVQDGIVNLKLVKDGKTKAENSVEGPSSPGIFRLALTPKNAGLYHLEFTLKNAHISDKISIPNIKIYPNQAAALADNPAHGAGDEISFLKEQAWKTDFAITQVKRQKIHDVIRTSGEIQPVKGKEKVVIAKSDGIVFYKNTKLQEGREVRQGEVLFTINTQGLLAANIEEKYQIAQAKLAKAKANFERAEKLLAKQIIGQKEYENRKMEFAVTEAELKTFTKNNQGNGQTVIAPMSGIIKSLMIRDGAFVKEGTTLVEITNNRRLMLRADVAQNYRPNLSQIVSANFKTAYQDQIQSIEDYKGKLISVGKTLEQGKHFLSVWFELDNLNDLVPGSFIELFLLTKPIDNQIIIPKSAIMQDYNVNYVYVQFAGESFEKREVKLGIDNGKNVQVLNGLSEGEWVVSKGAYQIKMASMSSSIPAHGHVH